MNSWETLLQDINLPTEVLLAILAALISGFLATGWRIFHRLFTAALTLFSADMNARRKLCGRYYLFHPPLTNSPDMRTRASFVRIRGNFLGTFFVEQIDPSSNSPAFRGPIVFFDNHFFCTMDAVGAASKGSSKFLAFYRPYPHEDADCMALIGRMCGLTFDNSPYGSPAIISSVIPKESDCAGYFASMGERFFLGSDRQAFHDLITKCAPTSDLKEYGGPWGRGVVPTKRKGFRLFGPVAR